MLRLKYYSLQLKLSFSSSTKFLAVPISNLDIVRICNEGIRDDIKNLEFNFNHKVSQKAEGNTLPLTISMFDQDAVFFEHTNSHYVSFVNAITGKGVSVYYPDFESIAIWTPAGGKAPFLCLEPWNGSGIFHQDDDIFEHKHGILTLESGKEKAYHLEISLIE